MYILFVFFELRVCKQKSKLRKNDIQPSMSFFLNKAINQIFLAFQEAM